MTEPKYIEQGARFDDSRAYRYHLWRRWKPGGTVLWIMLNPSTADETRLDPTLRRCLGFTIAWAERAINFAWCQPFGAFEVVNLYALRSTDPAGLWAVKDPIGPENDAVIRDRARWADLVIVGWGTNAKPERERQVAQLLADANVTARALKLTGKGSPGHPLYVAGDTEPFVWHAKGIR